MAIPATMPPVSPPVDWSAAAAEASDGFEPAETTPLQTSPVALRVEAAGAVLLADERAVLLALAAAPVALDVLGAVELAKTA